MNFEAKALRCFVVTVREGSVSQAAEKLGVRQPTVSAQLRRLELALGLSLLRRTTRRIELTNEGKRLLPLIEVLVGDAERLRQRIEEIHGRARTVLRLGSALYLQQVPERVALLEAFASARPDIDLEIDSHLQSSHIQALLCEELDAAFIVGYPIAARRIGHWNGGELEFPESLPRIPLRRRRLTLLALADSDLASFSIVRARALRGRSVLIPGPDHGRDFIGAVSQFLEARGAKIFVPAESTEAALAQYARKSGTPAISTGWFPAPGEKRGELVRRPVEDLEIETELALIHRRGDIARPARALLAFARQQRTA